MNYYRSDIDGLRAVAVLAVFLFHLDVSSLAPGGFVGVDVFFVISGYLIGRIVYQKVDADQFSFIEFYERRARRLAGPFFLTLIISYFAGLILMVPDDLVNLSESIVSSILLIANYHFFGEFNYFNSDKNLTPLLHIWTLSVEEQFYLFLPFLLFFQKRYIRNLLPIYFLGVGSFLAAVAVVRIDESEAFYLLPYRSWELLLGFFVYLAEQRDIKLSQYTRDVLAAIGLVLIGVSVFSYSGNTLFPAENALLPCLGAALLIFGSSSGLTFVGRVLSYSPLVFVGKLSYSIYLFHWPTIVFTRYFLDRPFSTIEMWIIFIVVMFASYLSMVLIEIPMRRRKFLIVPYETLALSVVLSIVLVLAVYPTIKMGGYPGRLSAEAVQFAEARRDWSVDQRQCVDRSPEKILVSDLCSANSDDSSSAVLLWGDSHATAILPVMQHLARAHQFHLVFVGTNGCPPILGIETEKGYCADTNRAVAQLIKERRFKVVITAANWHSYGRSNVIYRNGEILRENDKRLEDLLTHTLLMVQSNESQLLVIGQVPNYEIDIPNYLVKRSFLSPLDNVFGYERNSPTPSLEPWYFLNSIEMIPPDGLVMPAQTLCKGSCRLSDGSVSLYKDGGHLSFTGSNVLSSPIASELQRLLK